MFLSDEGPTFQTLDFAFYIDCTSTFYLNISIWSSFIQRLNVHVVLNALVFNLKPFIISVLNQENWSKEQRKRQ